MGKIIITISLTLFLTGCSLFGTKPSEPVVIYKEKPLICNAITPKKISPLHVELETIQDTDGIWWVAIDDKSYGNLAINNKDILRYILDLQAYADTLNACISKTQKP